MKNTFLGIEINYKNCPIDIREKFAKINIEEFIEKLKDENLDEFFVLSTCNRFGIYGIFENNKKLINSEYSRVIEGVELIKHVFKIASGLDSQILGEHQILGQLRESYNLAIKHKTIKHLTNQLIIRAIRTSKRIRNETNIRAISLNYYIKQILKNKNVKNILVLGTGEIGNMIIRNFRSFYNVFVVSRISKRAQELSKLYDIKFIEFEKFKNFLNNFDVIISATNNEEFLIEKSDISKLKSDVIIIDLSVPRSIDPDLKEFVSLYNIDTLKEVEYKVDEMEIEKANLIVEEEVKKFLDYLKEMKIYSFIKSFRDENYSKVLHIPTIYLKKIERNREIIIGSRGSLLALAQTRRVINELEKLFPYYSYTIKIIKTRGDKGEIEGIGAFVKEIEEKLLNNEIDIAVHSLKDIPLNLPDGLKISAILKRDDPRDVLISRENKKLFELKEGSIIGTSSYRRMSQILNLRNDLIIKELKGNVDTRLRKLNSGEYDAIVISKAGLDRLGLSYYITEIFDVEEIVPSAGQGAIAIETRINDFFINNLVIHLNDYQSYITTKLEREFLKLISGGCKMPHGVYCYIKENKAIMIAYINSKKYKVETTLNDIENLPYKLFEEVKYEI
ncbi:MAG: hydroxymethylbilane synthase [candidate division WOR-3 bacterium]